MKKLINAGGSEGEIKSLARQEGMITLREDGIKKLEKGITTLEEVLRTTNADEEHKEKK